MGLATPAALMLYTALLSSLATVSDHSSNASMQVLMFLFFLGHTVSQ